MTTTARNRVASYRTPPSPALSPAERQAVHADAVAAAVMALIRLLTDADPAVVLKGAEMILDLEKTRMRHNRPLAGTTEVLGLPPLDMEPPDETNEEVDCSIEMPTPHKGGGVFAGVRASARLHSDEERAEARTPTPSTLLNGPPPNKASPRIRDLS